MSEAQDSDYLGFARILDASLIAVFAGNRIEWMPRSFNLTGTARWYRIEHFAGLWVLHVCATKFNVPVVKCNSWWQNAVLNESVRHGDRAAQPPFSS